MTEPGDDADPDNPGPDTPGPDTPGPDNPGPGTSRRQRTAAHLVAALLAVIGILLSTFLVEASSRSDSAVLRWSIVVAAALLTYATTVLFGIYYRAFTDFLIRVFVRLVRSPGRRGWVRRRRGPLGLGVAAVALVLLLAQLIPPAAEPVGLEPGRLTVLSAFDESPRDPRRILISQWNQNHPDNQVDIIDVPDEPDGQYARFMNEAAAGAGNGVDVYVLDNVWTPRFIAEEYILPLDRASPAVDGSAFFDNSMRYCDSAAAEDGRLWCLPLNADAGLLFHRTDVPGFDVPGSWEDCLGDGARTTMAALAADPAAAGGPVAASAVQLTDDEILTVTALEAIWAFGGQVVNQDGAPVLSANGEQVVFDDRAKEGLAQLAAAYRDRAITLPDADVADEARAADAFRDGETLCMRNWPVAYDNLGDPTGARSVEFDVRSLPYPSALGGQNLAIAAGTDRPRAAQALIEFLTSPASQLILFEVGGFAPARLDVYDVPPGRARPYVDELRRALIDARPRPITQCYAEFSQAFQDGVRSALQNEGVLPADLPTSLASALRCPVGGV